MTGFTHLEPTLGAKWLELLKEIAPRVSRVALMFNAAAGQGDQHLVNLIQPTALAYLSSASRPRIWWMFLQRTSPSLINPKSIQKPSQRL